MSRKEQDIEARINEVRYADENREVLRLERINNAKRSAAKELKEAGMAEFIQDIKGIADAFPGSEVQTIELQGRTIFKMEAPIKDQFKKQQGAVSSPQPTDTGVKRQAKSF